MTASEKIQDLIGKRDNSTGIDADNYQREIDILVDSLPAVGAGNTADIDMAIARLG